MKIEWNEKMKSLQPYPPIVGDYRIRLDANESFLAPDDQWMEEMIKAVCDTAYNRYPDPYASEVCAKFAGYYHVNPALVTAGNGSDELISVIVNTFLMKGDKALVVRPDFSMYEIYLHMAECEYVTVDKNADFTLDVDRLIQAAQETGCRMIMFSNPLQPNLIRNPQRGGLCALSAKPKHW